MDKSSIITNPEKIPQFGRKRFISVCFGMALMAKKVPEDAIWKIYTQINGRFKFHFTWLPSILNYTALCWQALCKKNNNK